MSREFIQVGFGGRRSCGFLSVGLASLSKGWLYLRWRRVWRRELGFSRVLGVLVEIHWGGLGLAYHEQVVMNSVCADYRADSWSRGIMGVIDSSIISLKLVIGMEV